MTRKRRIEISSSESEHVGKDYLNDIQSAKSTSPRSFRATPEVKENGSGDAVIDLTGDLEPVSVQSQPLIMHQQLTQSFQLAKTVDTDLEPEKRPGIRPQRASDEFSASSLPRTTRRTAAANASWADPKSKDWNVLRVLLSDDCLAPDHLLNVSTSDTRDAKS
jgi:hypothetical protein